MTKCQADLVVAGFESFEVQRRAHGEATLSCKSNGWQIRSDAVCTISSSLCFKTSANANYMPMMSTATYTSLNAACDGHNVAKCRSTTPAVAATNPCILSMQNLLHFMHALLSHCVQSAENNLLTCILIAWLSLPKYSLSLRISASMAAIISA